MAVRIHQTKDGSSTLFSEKYDQFYHNPNGAASESIYVFFKKSGLIESLQAHDSITILEIGFGTGLNFLLLIDLLLENDLQIPVSFHSVEAFPIDHNIAADINFKKHLNHPELNDLLPDIFRGLKPGYNTYNNFKNLNISLNLFYGTFDTFQPIDLSADFIFHDAFSPDVNEELWTSDTFRKLSTFSKPKTVLVTYCAASKARGAMCAANWFVARAPGALGKREMTLASLSEEKLTKFKRVNEKRLAKRYSDGDFD